MNEITTLRGDLHGILLGICIMVTVAVFETMLYSIVKHWVWTKGFVAYTGAHCAQVH